MSLDYALYGTSIPNGRATNMDAIYYKKKKLNGSTLALAAVCDGVGSLEHGGFAAQQSTALLEAWFEGLTDVTRLGLLFREAILRINQSVVDQCQAMGIQSAATLTALLLVEGSYYIVNLGDSRIYGIYPRVVCLTRDDADEQNRITQYMGKKEGILPQYLEGTLTEQGFLLCSDGLYKRQSIQQISLRPKSIAPFSLRRQVRSMISKAVALGESDNISAIMIGVRT